MTAPLWSRNDQSDDLERGPVPTVSHPHRVLVSARVGGLHHDYGLEGDVSSCGLRRSTLADVGDYDLTGSTFLRFQKIDWGHRISIR